MKFYTENARILLSEDDLLGWLEYTGDDTRQLMSMNGWYLDGIDPYNGAHWDPRVPRVDFLYAPRVFVVGLSADGIVKSVKRLPKAETVGVEIHPSVFRTMTEDGQFATMAARPYDGVEAHVGEGRSFIENDPRHWDMIALMNIHAEHGPFNTVSPENLHTVEGVAALLDRLTERGIIVYEEIITNARSELAFRKFLNTCKAALSRPRLTDRGTEVADKDRNVSGSFYIFRWDFWEGSSVFRTLIIRRTPFTREEVRDLDIYYEEIAERYPGTQLLYNPYRPLGTEYETLIRGELPARGELLPRILSAAELTKGVTGRLNEPRDIEFVLAHYVCSGRLWFLRENGLSGAERNRLLALFRQAGYPVATDLSPATDDRPFPYAVWEEKTEITRIIDRLLFLVLFLAVPLVVLLVHGSRAPRKILLPAVLFTALSGFGYMLVEIILLQRFQLFIGDPTWTLVVVLGGMLVLSGLGSLTGHFLSRRAVGIVSALIPVALIGYLLFLNDLFRLCSGLSFSGKLVASLFLILPGSFLMGIPFPAALEMVKERSSGGFAALLFGISGGVSTLATAVALLVNVVHGFTASFSLGVLLYTGGFLFFLLLLALTRPRAVA